MVKFYYDDLGFRYKKEEFDSNEDVNKTTLYVRDLFGQVASIYTKPNSTYVQKEIPFYGNSRIGTFINGNEYHYELKDHLGNVRETIKVISNTPTWADSKSDYYPFGMKLMNSSSNPNINSYRYGYQGDYAEDETGEDGIKANSFQLRLYNPRLGRWLSPDPYGQYHSPYLAMGNTPVNGVDPDGGFFGESTDVTDNGDGTFTVVGAYDDGDKNIYIVDNNGDRTGKVIGETLHPWTFMSTDDATGEFCDHRDITFALDGLGNGDKLFEKYTEDFKPYSFLSAPLALGILVAKSRNGGVYDLKVNPELTSISAGGRYTPYMYGGRVATIREISNQVFGYNLRQVHSNSIDGKLFNPPVAFYIPNAKAAGWYNQKQNNGNGYNSGYPFYGEHTYSGTNIFEGYFLPDNK